MYCPWGLDCPREEENVYEREQQRKVPPSQLPLASPAPISCFSTESFPKPLPNRFFLKPSAQLCTLFPLSQILWAVHSSLESPYQPVPNKLCQPTVGSNCRRTAMGTWLAALKGEPPFLPSGKYLRWVGQTG